MRIVLLDAITLGDDLDLTIFESLGELKIYPTSTPQQVIERITEADVIIANKIELDESNLKHAKNIKLICLTATGTNNVDKVYTNKRGIVVSNVVNYSTSSVAQHTFALLFYLYEKLSYYDGYVKSGQYIADNSFTHFDKRFNELEGKTWGIIGLGNIGKRVAAIASAFGCTINYYSTSGRNSDAIYKQVDFQNLMSNSDIISIHAPLNNMTENLIDYKAMAMMKPSAYLINVGRGKIVNESDLRLALDDNLLAGAGLDVLEYEPMKQDNPLNAIKDSTKLIITPHIAWASVEARNKAIAETKENIVSYMNGRPRNQVQD